MVAVAQLVEHWIVIPGVVGSSPISHPFVSYLEAVDAGIFIDLQKVLKITLVL
jgi:hypothetical protein